MGKQRAKTVFQKEEQEGGAPVVQERQQNLGSCGGRRAPGAQAQLQRSVVQNKSPEARY